MKARNIKLSLARSGSWIAWQLDKKRRIGNRIPVLIYHRVLPEYLEGDRSIYAILPEQFESQMTYLREAGVKSLSLQEYAEIARGLRTTEGESVVITFDDGYADNYSVAWPIAKKYNIKINLFVCTEYVGLENSILMTQDGYLTPSKCELSRGIGARAQSHIREFPHLWRPLTWQELRRMKDAGVQIGFHSHSHRRLSLLKPEEITTDIDKGIAVFEKQLGYRPQFFAFPYGGYDSYNLQVVAALQRSGLDFIFATHLGRANLPSAQTIFPRLSISQADNLTIFQRKIFGGYDWLGHLQWFEHLGTKFCQKIKTVLRPLL